LILLFHHISNIKRMTEMWSLMLDQMRLDKMNKIWE